MAFNARCSLRFGLVAPPNNGGGPRLPPLGGIGHGHWGAVVGGKMMMMKTQNFS